MVAQGERGQVAPETVSVPISGCLYGSPVGRVVCPGLYAGRVAEQVKVGYSLNLWGRVTSFPFGELIGILPVPFERSAEESGLAFGYRVRDHLRHLEAQVHARLDAKRVRRLSRSNANEWFHLDDETLDVLWSSGMVMARRRRSGGQPFPIALLSARLSAPVPGYTLQPVCGK